MRNTHAVLFDLDGTLLDTAPDMAFVLNEVRKKHALPEIPFNHVRAAVSHGMKGMLESGGDMHETDPHFKSMIEECLALYQQHTTNATRLFPNMEKVLDHLDEHHIPWGIVTNKPKRFAFDILKNLELETRAACIICGDTLAKSKPDPEPILHACNLLQKSTSDCLFVGDSHVDVRASKAAGTKTMVALYGYISTQEDPFSWEADVYIHEPIEILDWLKQ